MAIAGIGTGSALAGQNTHALVNLQNQVDQLTAQLGTGQKSQDYAGLGSQAGLTVGLDAQLSALTGYGKAISLAGTNIGVAQNALTEISSLNDAVVQAVTGTAPFTLDSNGQTTTQSGAVSQLDAVLSALNSQAGGNYLFSGTAVKQPAVASTDAILNGNGAQAGLKQVIAERAQADLGTSGLGRLLIPAAAGATVSISDDVAGSPFGFKLAGITSNLTGATVTGTSGAPPGMSVTLGSNPNNGDTIQFSLTLPDGSSQTIDLQATTASPPGANQFTIGATPSLTAGSLQAALKNAVTGLAQTALPAASAIAAANDFFNSNPPQRVAGPPFDTASALVNGTSADTVMWYTGESGSTPARSTALAQVGPSTTVAYGARANEPVLSNIVANIAVLAATSYAPNDPNAAASYAALTQRVSTNLGGQSLAGMQADLANVQSTITNATSVNQQTQNTLTDMLQQIEGVSSDQVGAQLLTLQTNLQASMEVTGLLSQLSLVNFMSA
jgi:flagellar hook-associated protein 3 FlgL